MASGLKSCVCYSWVEKVGFQGWGVQVGVHDFVGFLAWTGITKLLEECSRGTGSNPYSVPPRWFLSQLEVRG